MQPINMVFFYYFFLDKIQIKLFFLLLFILSKSYNEEKKKKSHINWHQERQIFSFQMKTDMCFSLIRDHLRWIIINAEICILFWLQQGNVWELWPARISSFALWYSTFSITKSCCCVFLLVCFCFVFCFFPILLLFSGTVVV